MLAAIRFDDHPRTEVYEVDDIRSDRLLAAELLAVEPMCPQMLPEPVLGIRHFAAKLLRELP